MSGKILEVDDAVAHVQDGMTVGIGGWGSRRKPMALVRALIRSGVRGLTVVSFGGPDVGLLCATGQASRVVYGFATLDSIAIEPHFAQARQRGTVEVTELDEAMLVAGLRAAGRRLPFEVTRSGLGSDALLLNPDILTITSPYGDHEQLVAMPAIPLDVALIHLDRADERGNARHLGADPYFDDLFALAAEHVILSVEEVVPTGEVGGGELLINRSMVHAVVLAPNGAHPTAGLPRYGRDEEFQLAYAQSATSDAAWESFRSRFLLLSEPDYQREVSS